MNSIPKTGHTILSRDRYVIKKVSLLPEERERHAKTDKEEILHPHVEESLEETEAILDKCEEHKRKRQDEEEERKCFRSY